jgi:hypothetical protein
MGLVVATESFKTESIGNRGYEEFIDNFPVQVFAAEEIVAIMAQD